MQRKVPMFYDPDTDRWCVGQDGDSYGLHCGECFEIYLGESAIPCRIEMDRDWYLIINGVSFNLRKSNRYLVNMK